MQRDGRLLFDTANSYIVQCHSFLIWIKPGGVRGRLAPLAGDLARDHGCCVVGMESDMSETTFSIRQPDWLAAWLAGRALPVSDRERLGEVLALTEESVRRGSGGPFAAIVYDQRSGARLGVAVNTVVANSTALAHAETSALALAQQAQGSFTLAFEGGPEALLVTSSAPCTMCLGAIAWSGVSRVLFASTRGDVEAIGFDEGPLTPRWRAQLGARGIRVDGPRCRARAKAVLRDYLQTQGEIYNAR